MNCHSTQLLAQTSATPQTSSGTAFVNRSLLRSEGFRTRLGLWTLKKFSPHLCHTAQLKKNLSALRSVTGGWPTLSYILCVLVVTAARGITIILSCEVMKTSALLYVIHTSDRFSFVQSIYILSHKCRQYLHPNGTIDSLFMYRTAQLQE